MPIQTKMGTKDNTAQEWYYKCSPENISHFYIGLSNPNC